MRNLAMIVDFWANSPKPPPDGVRLIAARSIVASKTAMRAAFSDRLVHDPVVEIMMAAYIAGATSSPLSIDDACAATGNTPAVARRWILALQQEGLVDLVNSADGSRVTLSDRGLDCAIQAIDAMLEAQATILGR